MRLYPEWLVPPLEFSDRLSCTHEDAYLQRVSEVNLPARNLDKSSKMTLMAFQLTEVNSARLK